MYLKKNSVWSRETREMKLQGLDKAIAQDLTGSRAITRHSIKLEDDPLYGDKLWIVYRNCYIVI